MGIFRDDKPNDGDPQKEKSLSFMDLLTDKNAVNNIVGNIKGMMEEVKANQLRLESKVDLILSRLPLQDAEQVLNSATGETQDATQHLLS